MRPAILSNFRAGHRSIAAADSAFGVAFCIAFCIACGGGGTIEHDAGLMIDAALVPDAAIPDAAIPDASRPDAHIPTFAECAADDAAFVRNAYLAVLGRRPRSQAEVDVYTEIMSQVRALGAEGQTAADPQRVALSAMMDAPEYIDRWADQLMDALKVPRVDDQNMESCYGKSARPLDDGALAQFVRDNAGSATGDGGGEFTMLDLMRSALVLDDISPIYRAHLFVMLSRPTPAANVGRVQAELARRADFGQVFDATYLNRDVVCLGCHNSAFSVTQSPDPAENRHWPLPGLVELAVYGASTGIEVERAHAPFRFDGFVAEDDEPDQSQPWGWSPACGSFLPDLGEDDPAAIDGRFASLSGQRITMYDLEAALGRGFDDMVQSGLVIGPSGEIGNPDSAFAYMVSAAMVEAVWREVIGSPLTIANYFSRNTESRDLLDQLTQGFIASGFSLRELLIAIMTTPYFNRLPPAAGCGAGPYDMPAVYDPWVTGDADPERRGNGPADGVTSLGSRSLLRSVYRALEWPTGRFYSFPRLPDGYYFCSNLGCGQMANVCSDEGLCCEAFDLLCENPPPPEEPYAGAERAFQVAVGMFLKHGERGFRGLDFQARLVWEERLGSCRKPFGGEDFIDRLVARAVVEDTTVLDVVLALKDRLVGQPTIAADPAGGVSETLALETVLGTSLGTRAADLPDLADLTDRTRALCGVLLSSPQFVLTGFAPSGGEVPRLTPEDAAFDAICAELAARSLAGGLALTCSPGALSVAPASP